MDRRWFRLLKQDSAAYSDYLEYLADEKEKIRSLYAKSPTWEETLRLQGDERTIDKLTRACIMENREERQHQDYLKRVGKG